MRADGGIPQDTSRDAESACGTVLIGSSDKEQESCMSKNDRHAPHPPNPAPDPPVPTPPTPDPFPLPTPVPPALGVRRRL